MKKIAATKNAYPGFEYAPDDLARYIEASGIFSILLKSGKIVHHKPTNPDEFRVWLVDVGLPDIRKEK